MRRPHVLVLGVVVALGFTGCAGCARPVAGQASYQVGAAAGAGADAHQPTASHSVSPTRTHRRPAPRRTHRPVHHSAPPATTPPAPPTHTQAPPPPAPTKKPSHTTDPQAPSLGEFSVCLSLFQASRKADGAFRALPRHASLSSRAEVGRAYTTAYRQMMKILRASGLPPDDVVQLQATEVASATREMARALPSGRGVSNRQLRAAFVKLTQLCAH